MTDVCPVNERVDRGRWATGAEIPCLSLILKRQKEPRALTLQCPPHVQGKAGTDFTASSPGPAASRGTAGPREGRALPPASQRGPWPGPSLLLLHLQWCHRLRGVSQRQRPRAPFSPSESPAPGKRACWTGPPHENTARLRAPTDKLLNVSSAALPPDAPLVTGGWAVAPVSTGTGKGRGRAGSPSGRGSKGHGAVPGRGGGARQSHRSRDWGPVSRGN